MDNPSRSILLFSITFVVILALIISKKVRVDVGALLLAAFLGLFQWMGFQIVGPANTPSNVFRIISGFSLPVIITIIAITMVTSALERTGIINWISSRLIQFGGKQTQTYILIFSSFSAVLSLIMNNIATGSFLLPSVMQVSRKTGISPSKLLIPVAFGSILGGTATYFTTANIIMSDLLTQAHPAQRGLNFLDFFPTGGLLTVAGILFLWKFGDRLLPDHPSSLEQAQSILTGKELEDFYQIRDRLWEVTLLPESEFLNQSIREIDFGKKWGVTVAAILHANEYLLPFPGTRIHPGDKLLVVGREERIYSFADDRVVIKPYDRNFYLTDQGIIVGEAVITPHSHLINQTIEESLFRAKYGVTVVGIKRLDRSYRTDVGKIPLAIGDSLLFVSTIEQMSLMRKTNDFVLLTTNPSDLPLQKKRAVTVITVFLISVILSIIGIPVYLSILAAGLLLILLKYISIDELYHSIPWQTIFTIVGMASASLALVETGLAAKIGTILQPVSTLGLPFLAIVMYLFSGILTQVIGGQVVALVVGPVAISTAILAGVNPQAVAVAAAIGCSATFLLPLSHPVNLLMIGPGNYLFRDFFRIGFWLTLICLVMVFIAMLLFW